MVGCLTRRYQLPGGQAGLGVGTGCVPPFVVVGKIGIGAVLACGTFELDQGGLSTASSSSEETSRQIARKNLGHVAHAIPMDETLSSTSRRIAPATMSSLSGTGNPRVVR